MTPFAYWSVVVALTVWVVLSVHVASSVLAGYTNAGTRVTLRLFSMVFVCSFGWPVMLFVSFAKWTADEVRKGLQ